VTHTDEPMAYNTRGARIFALHTLIWLPIEFGIFILVLILISSSQLNITSQLKPILPFIVVLALEFLRRSRSISESTFHLVLSIKEVIRRLMRRTLDNALALVCILLPAIFFAYVGSQSIKAIKLPLASLGDQQTSLVAGLLTLSTAILAFLAAGVALVLPLILNWYPSSFSRAFISNRFLILNFFLCICSGVFSIFIL
jgi:hypothetical protein